MYVTRQERLTWGKWDQNTQNNLSIVYVHKCVVQYNQDQSKQAPH